MVATCIHDAHVAMTTDVKAATSTDGTTKNQKKIGE